ncbi:hypothetical protein [Paraburkholderia hospita]|uniref:hypothetical protein n=1 Tax=Paraburkholderia hospita TaxID=169430 RepID=UPI0008A7DE37|nr:hypothetical protein [Paraburkholderia hospita]SEH89850.1 hypothetical protein SAMN05192544_1011152 [Paraburkholderia hospita]
MALPGSGIIYMSQVNSELGRPATQTLWLADAELRNTIADVGSGALSMANCRGKTYHATQNAVIPYSYVGQANFQGGQAFRGASPAYVERVTDSNPDSGQIYGWWLRIYFNQNPNHGGNLWVLNNSTGIAYTLNKAAGNMWQVYVGNPGSGVPDNWIPTVPAGNVYNYSIYAV